MVRGCGGEESLDEVRTMGGTQGRYAGIRVLLSQVGIGGEGGGGLSGCAGRAQGRMCGTKEGLRTNLRARLRTEMHKMFKRLAAVVIPVGDSGDLVVGLVVGGVEPEHVEAQPQRLSTRSLVSDGAWHVEAAEIHQSADELWSMTNSRRELNARGICMALLYFDHSEQILESTVSRVGF